MLAYLAATVCFRFSRFRWSVGVIFGNAYNCVLLCSFHHQVVIHRQGWTLVLNPDGTTTAWNKDKTRTLHSHGPPARPG